jgi:hypothetical protein
MIAIGTPPKVVVSGEYAFHQKGEEEAGAGASAWKEMVSRQTSVRARVINAPAPRQNSVVAVFFLVVSLSS